VQKIAEHLQLAMPPEHDPVVLRDLPDSIHHQLDNVLKVPKGGEKVSDNSYQ